jgi:apolipoprotein N-acyltransferase
VAWVALVPFFLALRSPHRTRFARPFLLGLTTGVAYFCGTVYWTAATMETFGGLSRLSAVPVAGLLVAYLALFPALTAVVVDGLVRRWGARALLAGPAVWVASELLRTYLFSGFPWVLLGYSQATVLPVIQVASLAGVYGVSWLVAHVAATAAYAWTVGARRAGPAVTATVALVALTWAWGALRIERGTLVRAGTPVTVALVQGNVPQDEKWDPAHAPEILGRYLSMSREAAARGATFVLWPESSTPFNFEEHAAGAGAVRDLAASTNTWLLFGSDQVERAGTPRYYNAAFLLAPSGTTAGVYRKVHLVPFGEYVPIRSVLFFAAPLVETVSDFSPGTEVTILRVGSHRASVAICYEVVYPALARQAVLGGSQLLTTITNDAWYGWSSAPHQHFEQAAVRAVEQGRYLLRAANTGISGIVDPYGRVIVKTRLFETAVVTGEARFLDDRTVYGTIGDSFAWACAALTLLLLVPRRARSTEGDIR